ncbi:hypothetical protein BGW80DRAFT_817855 [Lactifluus volemus]|nr:hypothetical protein BGW80DRAFT_817855 [Lactifluus volemus]
MKEPFPALKSLLFEISGFDEIHVDTLLNGSAPCLQDLTLRAISFTSLPQLLLSTSDFTSLRLLSVDSEYVAPETIATSLCALPKLESLTFLFSKSYPLLERRNRAPPPLTRFVLPALTSIEFRGESEYLEVLAGRFDAPLLDEFQIAFFRQPVFDIPQTVRFFSRLDSFSPSSLTLIFRMWECAYVSFPSNTMHRFVWPSNRWWKIRCKKVDLQVIYVTQICSQILPFRSSVTSLTIDTVDIIDDPMQWLQLFHSFPSVQILQIHLALQPFVTSVLEGPMEESPAATEVFPSLHSLSIVVWIRPDESVQQPIQSSIRRRSGRTVAVSRIFYRERQHD